MAGAGIDAPLRRAGVEPRQQPRICDDGDAFGFARGQCHAFEAKQSKATDPGYVRIDSQLMVAFDGIPVLEKPTGALAGPSRVFELRTYESHNKAAHRKKTEMFNKGEIDIFRRRGLRPVLFGSNIIGTRLPSLTYLLVFEDMAAREKNWPQFVSHPDWKTLVATPGYSDAEIVSNRHSFILRPTSYSQI